MLPAWVSSLVAEFGVALVKWAASEAMGNLKQSQEMAEAERLSGVRNGINAKKYAEAKTRADQIRAAIALLNRSDSL